jgi:DNA-binding NarL/FixJ family response regulator
MVLDGEHYSICGGKDGSNDDQRARVETLTVRELDVAILVAAGLRNKQIARQLGISPFTVGAHLVRIYCKLGVDSRCALATHIGTSPSRSFPPLPRRRLNGVALQDGD